MSELPKHLRFQVKNCIENWYKNIQYDVIYYWSQDDTWFVVIKHYSPTEDKTKLDCVRIFPSYRIPGEYHLSVDKTVEL